MNTYTQTTAPTFESVWAAIQENAKIQKENERFLTEKFAETDRILTEKFAETDRQMKETDKRMKELQKTMGSFANNQGSFAEEYFFNSFESNKRNFFGEKFDEIVKNLSHFWQGLKDEYDIVMYNHDAVALIEVKYKARMENVPNVLKKAETFRILFPQYKDFKIYLGLAAMSFYPLVEEECIKEGIVIIKQVGDKVVIYDENLKVF